MDGDGWSVFPGAMFAMWHSTSKLNVNKAQKPILNKDNMKANKHPKLSCFWIMVTHWPRAAVMKCQPQGVQDVAACESSFCKGLVCTFSFGLWQVVADGDRDHLIHVHGVFDLVGNGMTRTGNASCLSISRDVGPNGLAMLLG